MYSLSSSQGRLPSYPQVPSAFSSSDIYVVCLVSDKPRSLIRVSFMSMVGSLFTGCWQLASGYASTRLPPAAIQCTFPTCEFMSVMPILSCQKDEDTLVSISQTT